MLFISFFLLKDGQIINQIITSLSPEKYLNKVKTIVVETKDLLSRYFIGVLVQVTVVVLVITIGLSIAGVKNALLIGGRSPGKGAAHRHIRGTTTAVVPRWECHNNHRSVPQCCHSYERS